jgi:hypothetical protein
MPLKRAKEPWRKERIRWASNEDLASVRFYERDENPADTEEPNAVLAYTEVYLEERNLAAHDAAVAVLKREQSMQSHILVPSDSGSDADDGAYKMSGKTQVGMVVCCAHTVLPKFPPHFAAHRKKKGVL